jgi:hypothetical protein
MELGECAFNRTSESKTSCAIAGLPTSCKFHLSHIAIPRGCQRKTNKQSFTSDDRSVRVSTAGLWGCHENTNSNTEHWNANLAKQ